MTIIAGHTFTFGTCECFRRRVDLNGAAREAIALGTTLINQPGVAHVGLCTEHEWGHILQDVIDENKVFGDVLASP